PSPQGPAGLGNRRLGQSALKARLKVDSTSSHGSRVFCNWLSLCRAFSASPSFCVYLGLRYGPKPAFACLVHRIISRRPTAVGQLADFQGGPSRTGSNDEHI